VSDAGPDGAARAVDFPGVRAAESADLVAALDAARESHAAELTVARDRSFEEGRRLGREEAAAQAEAKVTEAAETLRSMIKEVKLQRGSLLREAETRIVELAVRVASRILDHQVEVDRKAVVGVVRGALRLVERDDSVVIRVHPDDLPLMEEHLRETGGPTGSGIRAVPSAQVPRGGCLIETEGGSLDARIESQLDELRSVLAGPGEGDAAPVPISEAELPAGRSENGPGGEAVTEEAA
jgi:flagellar assembly protein FliH